MKPSLGPMLRSCRQAGGTGIGRPGEEGHPEGGWQRRMLAGGASGRRLDDLEIDAPQQLGGDAAADGQHLRAHDPLGQS